MISFLLTSALFSFGIVDFARKVAEEQDYSARHPGHVFLVGLHQEEAEGLLREVNDARTKLDQLAEGAYDSECDCCRKTARIIGLAAGDWEDDRWV